MKILFLTLLDFTSLNERNIYTDLLRKFINENHTVNIISPCERRKHQSTVLIKKEKYKILKLKIGNIQKTNIFEKGLSTLLLESKFKRAIKKYFSNICYDLILYSTPPITLYKAIQYIKKRDNAKTYLLLKDIFPQNALDMKLLKNKGIKGLLYSYFRNKEKNLYKLSNYIGCMSEANVNYILKHNLYLTRDKVEICPNSEELLELDINNRIKYDVKVKYNIPLDKTIFIYGGNLGKPQGIDFLIKCIKKIQNDNRIFFIVVGSGTELKKLKHYFLNEKPNNALLLHELPKSDYEFLVASSDIGLLFLNKNFTIPNFPSRILTYMQFSLPVLAVTDVNTDIGTVIEKGDFGYWVESGNINQFYEKVQKLIDSNLRYKMGLNSRKYLEKHYTVNNSYDIIMKHFK